MAKILFSLFASLVITLSAKAAVDPKIQWQVLRSRHFVLVYDAQQQELADFYLIRLERAREKLGTLWVEMPDQLTVVLNDRTDLTNGYATAMPYAHIMIFPVLPGPQESISEYGDWAEEVLIHEMTHILSFEQRRGIPYGLSLIFGNIITPNMLLPNWWLEGVAVDAETRLSNWGRLRSTFQDASLRAMVSSPRWSQFNFSEINETAIPTWPYGSRPYLFGSLMWSEMIALKGEKMVNDLHVRFGGRAPFALTGPIAENFDGQDLPDLFERSKQSVQNAVAEQKKVLGKKAFSETEKFNDADFVETMSPSISPDGLKLAFIAKDDSLKRSVQVLRRPSLDVPFEASQRVRSFGQKTEITTPNVDITIPRLQENPDSPPTGTINRISWAPDSQSFVFDLVHEKNIFHDVSDLRVFDFDKAKARALTKNLRAREPDYSPDGHRIAFVKIEKDRTSLAVWDVEKEQETVIYRPELLQRVSWPVWLDNDRLLFSVRGGGHERLAWVSSADSQPHWVLPQFKQASLPLQKGDRVYFISSDSGVRNLYQTDLNFHQAKPVTHLWTGAYASDFDQSKKELWITEIGEMGFELSKLPVEKEFKESSLPTTGPLLAGRYPAQVEKPIKEVEEKTKEDYSPWRYLIPRYWLPFIGWDDKGVKISATTSAMDPLSRHAYTLYGAYDSSINRSSYSAAYVNQVLRPTLIFQTADISSYLADPDRPTRAQLNVFTSAWQLASIDPYLFFNVGWVWSQREQYDVRSTQTGPSVGLTYFNASQTGEQISPESGGGVSLSATNYLEGENREFFTQTSLSFTKFGRIPWGRHHAWMARGVAQYIDRQVSIANYDSTLSTLNGAAPALTAYQMRGYVTGAFLGKNIANLDLEYRFPIKRFDWGANYAPIFFQRVSGALVADGIWLEGYAYDITQDPRLYRRVTPWKGFGSIGAEGKFDMTLAYHIPFQLILGVYAPIKNEFTDGDPRLGLGIKF